MTVESVVLKSGPYNTDGSTVAWNVTFQYQVASELLVQLLNTTTNVIRNLNYNTDYTVSPASGTSGAITILPNAASGIANSSGQFPAGYTITITPNIALTQNEAFPSSGKFPTDDVEYGLDRLTLITQQSQNLLNNSIQIPSTDSGVSTTLPAAAVRAAKVLGFDSLGNIIVAAGFGTWRGIWATATVYNYGDIVQDGASGANTTNYYYCVKANTSGTWSSDLSAGDWVLAINSVTISASAASTAVTALAATSTTSLAIGTGAQTFTTQSGKGFAVGQYLQITSNASALNYMHGTVTSYSGTSLVMNITDVGGSGTHADWNISIAGTQGPTGATGSTGATGATGPSGPVSSVGLSTDASYLTVASSPVTNSGTITINKTASLTQNQVVATPNGASGKADLRALVNGDLPTSGVSAGSYTNVSATVNAQGIITAMSSGAGTAVVSVKKQIFTGSGTYTPSTGMLYCDVELVGAGGGGTTAGTGGGGGEWRKGLFSAATIGSSQTVTIGAGGGGGSGVNGTAGGATSLGSLLVGNGGNGGTYISSGGSYGGAAGGSGGGGTGLSVPGGNAAMYNSGYVGGSEGGSSVFGRGASLGYSSTTAPSPSGYGAGGGSGSSPTSGTSGVMYITEFCSQ